MHSPASTENLLFWRTCARWYDRFVNRAFPEYLDIVERIVADATPSDRLLEVATGTGNVALSLAKGCGRIDAIDYSSGMAPEAGLAGGRGANEVVRSRATDMAVAGNGTFGERHWSIAASFVLANQRWTTSVKLRHGDSTVDKSPEWIVSGFKHAARYRLQASALREPSYPENLPPTIGQDGYGLASAVSHLMRTDPDAYRLLSQRLRQIVPSVTGLRTSPVKIPRTRRHTVGVDGLSVPLNGEDEVVGDELLFDTVDGEGIPGAAQSEGTLLVLAVLTALALPTRPRLMLLDHIDAGLHPAAQRERVAGANA